MKNIINKVFVCLTLVSSLLFINCESAEENLQEALSIEEKVEILESAEWLLKGFEDRVMHTFESGERFTYYGTDSVFDDEAIPGTQEYTIVGNLLMLDFNFGNTGTYDLKVSCSNNIVEFFVDGVLHSTYLRRNSNYQDCL